MFEMEGDALMKKRALKMRRTGGRGLEVWIGWGKGGNRVTGDGWARLFRLFVDRLFRHHEPDALLLRVLERGEV